MTPRVLVIALLSMLSLAACHSSTGGEDAKPGDAKTASVLVHTVMPTRKYENEGGPGIPAIVEILRENSRNPREDIDRFVGSIAVNWLLAATDAHAKNHALLHGPGGVVRLAPFYDIASFLPYAEPTLHRVKLAMRIGGEYLVRRIGRADWLALAKATGLASDQVLATVEDILSRMPSALDAVRERVVAERLDERVITRLARSIGGHVRLCARSWS